MVQSTGSQRVWILLDFPGGSDGKASVYNAGDPGSSPGLGRSPGDPPAPVPDRLCKDKSKFRIKVERRVRNAAGVVRAQSRTTESLIVVLRYVWSMASQEA